MLNLLRLLLFSSPLYSRILVIGRASDEFLWERRLWPATAERINNLCVKVGGKPSVAWVIRDRRTRRIVSSGKRRWKPERDEPWVFQEDDRRKWFLFHLTVTCPSIDHCKSRGTWPAVLIDLRENEESSFPQTVHVALRSGMGEAARAEVAALVDGFSAVGPALVAIGESRWYEKDWGGAMDAWVSGYAARGWDSLDSPNLDKIVGPWREVVFSDVLKSLS